MKDRHFMLKTTCGIATGMLTMGFMTTAVATEPCGDFGECKTLIEFNATDGDIGFHFLVDGDDLNSIRLHDPDDVKVFQDMAKGPLSEQKLTETFAESAEPLCYDPILDEDPENDDEDFVTLEEFLERWAAGTYVFTGSADEGEKLEGETELTYELPAAPDLTSGSFGFDGSVISWGSGVDLGVCATEAELTTLVEMEILPIHPRDVVVDAFEIVFEPDVEDGDPLGQLKFTIRVAGDIATKAVTVPADYLASLPADTLIKVEVGAIGGEDNASFTEIFDICINEDEGCEEEDDEEED